MVLKGHIEKKWYFEGYTLKNISYIMKSIPSKKKALLRLSRRLFNGFNFGFGMVFGKTKKDSSLMCQYKTLVSLFCLYILEMLSIDMILDNVFADKTVRSNILEGILSINYDEGLETISYKPKGL